jgi:hypothetical protein
MGSVFVARFYGNVGYATSEETAPGVWEDSFTVRPYYGDVIRNVRRWENGEGVNDNLNVNNQISIVADAYAYQNFHAIKYIEWMGNKWKVTSVEVERPRLVLSIGGVFNGPAD